MKKILRNIALIFLLIAAVMSFGACGSNTDTGSKSAASSSEDIVTGEKTEDEEVISEEITVTPVSGECGSNLTYNLTEDGTLTISGTGSMREFAYDDDTNTAIAPWFEQRDGIKKVVVENGVEKISPRIFCEYKNLEEVILPDSITKLDTSTFARCENLKTINIPDNCYFIGISAFEGCASLENITLPSALEEVCQNTFRGCKSLKKIEIPNGAEEIYNGAFWRCESLEEVTIPPSVTQISDYAFSDCTSLKKITIPASVTVIESTAFSGCENVTVYTSKGSAAEAYFTDSDLKVEIVSE